ncbi:hypothetical protein BBJ41_01005 [Burkholderia stabilis]|uniref:hypothetical protein n=1 Tax=Burkholderia stabilis TaxID=95485 RepID=UPI00085163D5|nr:hypothetical protein [Burkholderia stabilis]AOR66243.1 hypothetical protein BBJ41_01005 [Burkholderia stabilis]HDR9491949.1 hypothetical protein [Burkholderia stabilis]HDR9524017.1 hypothetical protein [Burkholderia stabilis]HDR9530676.1 hypothetical protein [Burkholderia stabilis]HDR9539406.1 hypothetical protein [Burkholderia stabilis]
MTTQIQCTSAELPNLMPLLATLTDFTLNVIPAAITTAAQAAQAVVQPAVPAPVVQVAAPVAPVASVAPAEDVSTMGTAEVMELFDYATPQAVADLMQRAEIPAIQRGRNNYYDRAKVLALKKLYSETFSLSEASELVGYKNPSGLLLHIGQRRITPTMVAGHMRFRVKDLEQFEKLRGPVRRRW